MSLTITERVQDGWVVVTVAGEVDIYTTPLLRSHLLDATISAAEASKSSEAPEPRSPRHGIVVDLTEVPFMDSAGLGALIGAYKRASASAVAMRLAGVGFQVAKLLQITGLDRVIDVRPSAAAATSPT